MYLAHSECTILVHNSQDIILLWISTNFLQPAHLFLMVCCETVIMVIGGHVDDLNHALQHF